MPFKSSGQPNLLYARDFCGKQLRWQFLQDPCDPRRAPDVVFNDPSFCPLFSGSEHLQHRLTEVLDSWDGWSGCSPLSDLIELLLALYTDHHRRRIASLEDDRILFELAMVEELGCTEMLLAGSADSQVRQACFAVPVYTNTSPAHQLIAHLQASSSSGTTHQQKHQQKQPSPLQQEQQDPHQQFMLHAAFRTGPNIDPHTPPDLQLKAPAWFRDYLPPLSLPSWDPQTSLVEYVPHLAERLDKHLQDSCPAATLRFDLVKRLAGQLGPPLEINMHNSGSTTGTTSTGTSTGGAATTAVGSRGRYSSTAVFHVVFEQQVLLLYVEFGPAFPGDAPVLVLQRSRRQGAESYAALPNVPWSPRWPVDEMTARLFNFVKQHAANVAKEPKSAAPSPVPGAVYYW